MLKHTGSFVGLILRLTANSSVLGNVTFKYKYFFNVLLPPIIFSSGYELHQGRFFRHIGTILTFAFAGTFISAVVLAVILYLWTMLRLESIKLTFVDAISVGASLSATDPVTILAIFNTYKVDPKLYTTIFGESILNDAIAIVLFDTAQKYSSFSTEVEEGEVKPGLTPLKLFESFGLFLLVFFGSLVIGLVIGIATSLLLKFTYVRRFAKIESCLVLLIAYASYFFANAVQMSGTLPITFLSSEVRTPRLIACTRHRVSSLLQHLYQTLRIPQHVSSHTAFDQIRLPGSLPTLRKLHLHLPGHLSLY